MHCSVWRFRGDPDALERGYRAMMEQVPASNHVLHAAARTPDGLLIFDTCPSAEAYHAFFGSEQVRDAGRAMSICPPSDKSSCMSPNCNVVWHIG